MVLKTVGEQQFHPELLAINENRLSTQRELDGVERAEAIVDNTEAPIIAELKNFDAILRTASTTALQIIDELQKIDNGHEDYNDMNADNLAEEREYFLNNAKKLADELSSYEALMKYVTDSAEYKRIGKVSEKANEIFSNVCQSLHEMINNGTNQSTENIIQLQKMLENGYFIIEAITQSHLENKSAIIFELFKDQVREAQAIYFPENKNQKAEVIELN